MTTQTSTHVVLGASGAAGSAILTALVDGGLDARGVNRSGPGAAAPRGVDWRTADAASAEGLRVALEGADVVYMAAQPAYHRWSQEFPAMMQCVVEAAVAAGARRLVMVDNLYAYGPGSSPMTEASAQAATDARGAPGQRWPTRCWPRTERAGSRSSSGGHRTTSGPHADNSAITALAIEPVAGRGKLRWMGSLEAAHSCAYLPDVARAFVALGGRRGHRRADLAPPARSGRHRRPVPRPGQRGPPAAAGHGPGQHPDAATRRAVPPHLARVAAAGLPVDRAVPRRRRGLPRAVPRLRVDPDGRRPSPRPSPTTGPFPATGTVAA